MIYEQHLTAIEMSEDAPKFQGRMFNVFPDMEGVTVVRGEKMVANSLDPPPEPVTWSVSRDNEGNASIEFEKGTKKLTIALTQDIVSELIRDLIFISPWQLPWEDNKYVKKETENG